MATRQPIHPAVREAILQAKAAGHIVAVTVTANTTVVSITHTHESAKSTADQADDRAAIKAFAGIIAG